MDGVGSGDLHIGEEGLHRMNVSRVRTFDLPSVQSREEQQEVMPENSRDLVVVEDVEPEVEEAESSKFKLPAKSVPDSERQHES